MILSGDRQVPPNPTKATGTCDIFLEQWQVDDFLTGVQWGRMYYDCTHNVPNAAFGQFRLGIGGPVILDFSDQLGLPRQYGVQTVSRDDAQSILGGGLWSVIDESFTGARIAAPLPCVNGTQADPTKKALCLQDQRFKTEIDWMDEDGNSGSAVGAFPGPDDDSGLFFFFAQDNWEMLIKVIDGCEINNNFWVFHAGMTNVEYTLTVTDTQTNEHYSVFNPLNNLPEPIRDTSAFATCP